ncbi:MAG: hypothetical protein H0X37_21830 [Herpetosiphonaceae bacterium]|nr:hypothetical protein [Herpetosiphonaceae bacterium]
MTTFLRPLLDLLPDRRLPRVVLLAIRGILAGATPVITALAQSVAHTDCDPWPAAKRIYRLLANPRVPSRLFTTGLYQLARATVAHEQPEYLVIAVDPVNFEKPYTQALEGVSTVHKSTPPDRLGRARLARGYPAITATVVNTRVPATTYANWFSYTLDFRSQNWEFKRAFRTTRGLFPTQRLRFVGDAGLDDQKLFGWIAKVKGEFVMRASHLERLVEVENARLHRWEREQLEELVSSIPFTTRWQVAFQHAGTSRIATVQVGWLHLRLLETQQDLWAVVVEEDERAERAVRRLVLLTTVAVASEAEARAVYEDWRLRRRLEHGYRFDQEQGLDVEDMRVQTLERMQRLFVLVLLAAEFVFHVMEPWPPAAVRWLRRLGGKLGRSIDRDGPYLLLRGLQAVWQTVATLTLMLIEPFPHHAFDDT